MNNIKKLLSSRPLSHKWLQKKTREVGREEFERSANLSKSKAIYHVTDMEAARTILESKTIYGIDVVSAAHFHYSPEKIGAQAIKTGLFLGFKWAGPVKRGIWSGKGSSHSDCSPNQLLEVPVSEKDDRTWELRLYPGTQNLELCYLEFEGRGYLLKEPIVLRVICGF